MDYRTYLKNYPDKDGRFGPYGGAYLTDEPVSYTHLSGPVHCNQTGLPGA